MKKRILTILVLLALVLIPFKNVYAEELNNDVVGENPTTNDVSSGEETLNDSSNEETTLPEAGQTEPQTVEPEEEPVLRDTPVTLAGDEAPVLRSTPWSFDITYDANGGIKGENWIDSITVLKRMTFGLDVIQIAEPDESFVSAAEGYVFAGLEINGEVYSIGSTDSIRVSDDTTVKFLWNQLITEVEITLTPPFVGDTNDMDQIDGDNGSYWDWESQTNPPVAEVLEDAPYTVEFTYWIMGFEGEEYDTPFVGTFERDTEYHAEIVLYSKEGYQFAEDAVITVNGEPIDALIYLDGFYNDNQEFVSEMSVGKIVVPFEYLIIDGDNQTHVAYKDGDLVVTSNGEASKLVELQVDGNTLDPENYEIESGSTIATVKRAYLDSLDAGTHLLTFVYPDGQVSANFEIVKSNNPQTADIIQVWYMLIAISVMGLGYSFVSFRKEN